MQGRTVSAPNPTLSYASDDEVHNETSDRESRAELKEVMAAEGHASGVEASLGKHARDDVEDEAGQGAAKAARVSVLCRCCVGSA